ncbi:MAG TPA: gamma-glutamylcyclotransferase family protein [Kofleriaceae bacterium]
MGEKRRNTRTFEVERTTGSHEILDRLFVYGTLRQGQTARSLVANQISKCVKAWTAGAIYAFPMGHPGFVEGDGTGRVEGEVIWLTELAATFGLLDAYEGQDFVRVIRKVHLEDTDDPVWAWVYTLSDPAAVKFGTVIQHGDWVRYWNEQG